jgi:hypothetical protein
MSFVFLLPFTRTNFMVQIRYIAMKDAPSTQRMMSVSHRGNPGSRAHLPNARFTKGNQDSKVMMGKGFLNRAARMKAELGLVARFCARSIVETKRSLIRPADKTITKPPWPNRSKQCGQRSVV